MRFNKQEMITLAQQPSHKFDKEGLLFVRERQEGFFRRTEKRDSKRSKKRERLSDLNCYGGSQKANFERWCRLRGNLLFYLKSDDQLSDLLGVIVLQNYSVQLDESPIEGPFSFQIVFENGVCQQIAAHTESERDSWLEAIKQASYEIMRARLLNLRRQLEEKRKPDLDINMWRLRKNQPKLDLTKVPLCEICFSCDNLMCDGHGRSPNPAIVVSIFIPNESVWINYANTEIIKDNSNPTFLRTIWLQCSDGLTEDSVLRVSVYDVRECISGTAVKMGHCETILSSLLETTHSGNNGQRVRLPLSSPSIRSDSDKIVGFVTMTICQPDKQIGHNMSTESTPCKSLMYNNHIPMINHRRTQSLPPRLGSRLRVPLQNYLYLLFDNVSFVTYRFHSGLRGDISVYEIMAESKLCFYLPQQLLNIWILEEKELLQEVSGMGELSEPWHSKQVELLDRHLQLLHLYSQAKQNLENQKGIHFKPSSRKNDRSLEFAPINLHLQRIWVQNDTLKKSGFYDTITVGAFTAHSHKSKTGGLIKLLQQLKEAPLKTNGHAMASSKITMAFDAIQAIKLLRREVVDAMKTLLNLAKDKQTAGMMPICKDMMSKTRILLSLWDPKLVEEALNFIEEHKVTPVSCDDHESIKSSSNYHVSPFKRITSQINFNLQSPDTEDLYTPESPKSLRNLMKLNTKGIHEEIDMINSEDQQQFIVFPESKGEIDSNENDAKNISATLPGSIENSLVVESNNGMRAGQFLDTYSMCNSPSANYYKPTEEPEPWELTQLNIEASIMCLVSKVKFLCGRCNSPAVRLRSQRCRSFRSNLPSTNQVTNGHQPVSLDSKMSQLDDSNSDNGSQTVNNNALPRNKFTEGLDFNLMTDWPTELKPSMRKLRQAMDGLLKTARLTHSVFRVQEDKRSAERSCNVRYRRHVCFSQALTALVSGLMAKLWCQKPDPEFLHTLSSIGCLASFECLLSYYGNEIDMWGDMAIAVEDLATVNFTLLPVSQAVRENPKDEIMPRIIGSKNSLCVLLPVPDLIQSLLPSKAIAPFRVTPVFFNIGINEMATLAENLGNTKPQDSSNIDNFERLNEFCSRYRKLNLFHNDDCERHRTSVGELMDSLKDSLHSNKSKNVEILQIVAKVCRRLKGLRFTSCKSAKDRTGMSVTLEQCSILNLEYGLADSEIQRVLDCMRSEGCRRENTYKNTGVRKYAFNRLQHFTLPQMYRPPAGTYGSSQT